MDCGKLMDVYWICDGVVCRNTLFQSVSTNCTGKKEIFEDATKQHLGVKWAPAGAAWPRSSHYQRCFLPSERDSKERAKWKEPNEK